MHKSVFSLVCAFSLFHVFISAHAPTSVDAAAHTHARAMLNALSVDDKIGQLFMVPAVSDEQLNEHFMTTQPYAMRQKDVEQLITQCKVGGVIFLGRGTPQSQIERTQRYQQLSAVPLLVGMDFEWGLSMRLNDVVPFPRAMTLGALADEQMIYHVAHEIGRQAHAVGAHIVFAPVVDVNNNPENPIINSRSFGDDPQAVARKGILMMRGLHDGGVLSCAKHFIGHGNVRVDSHYDLPTITDDLASLHATELYPFKKLIEAGVPAVMVAHLAVPALDPRPEYPCSLSRTVVTDLLQHELGFKGLVVTDGLGMVGVAKNRAPGEPECEALLAGADILLCPVDVPAAVVRIKQALADGRLTEQELDKRVMKIALIKAWLMQHNQKAFAPVYDHGALHTDHAYALKKEVYTQAVTLVRDEKKLVPIQSDACVVLHIHGLRTPADIVRREQAIRAEINALVDAGRDLVVVLYGTPYALPLFDRVGTVLIAYEDDPDAVDAVARILQGDLVATGQLPVRME